MVEILLSTYNGECYLRDLMDSILNQSCKEWHLLVRDDGSTDKTMDIISEYVEKNPQKISVCADENGKNMGVLRSFEKLLSQANSSYYMFSDQDDVWLPDKVKFALQKIQEIEQEDLPLIVCSDLIVVNQEKEILNESFWKYSHINTSLIDSFEMLAVANYVTGCTMIFNEKAKKCSLPFGKHAILHDHWIPLCVVSNGGKIEISVPQILYRQHSFNVVGAKKNNFNMWYYLRKTFLFFRTSMDSFAMWRQANEVRKMSIFNFLKCKLYYIYKR